MSTFAIGDIHGCRDALDQLLAKLPFDDGDRLVFLGDYIDRGPDSKGVVDRLISLRDSRPAGSTVFLMGNHEEMLLDYLRGVGEERFLRVGGTETVISYGGFPLHLPDEHRRFFNGLRLSWEDDRYIYVHAGLRPGVPMDAQSPEDLVWIRGDFLYSDYVFEKKVVFGHIPMKDSNPFVSVTKIGVDTGAVYGGRLTAVRLPEEEFFQVQGGCHEAC